MTRETWIRMVRDEIDRLGGGTIEYTGAGHLKLLMPGCGPVFLSSTPSEGWRARQNARAVMRRAARGRK